MNTKLITSYFSTEKGLYIAYLTEHPEISAQGLTHDDAYEQLMIVIDEMEVENESINSYKKNTERN
jgi:predicted RNase H-like HicB family nuclease